MEKLIKDIAKKISSKGLGLFFDIKLYATAITFNDACGYLYVFEKIPNKAFGVFKFGKVVKWKELAPSFESDYNDLKMIERRGYEIHFMDSTDNADFVLRNSLANVFNVY